MLIDSAVAQGIMAQVRVFGGSIGIAASTAILGIKQRQKLLETGLLTPAQLQSLRNAMSSLSADQVHAVKQAFTDALNNTLVVCAIISGICLLVTIGCYQKDPPSIAERREQQQANQAIRQKALAELRSEPGAVDATETKGQAIV